MPSTIGLRHSGTLAGNEEIWLPAGALHAESGELTLSPEWLARAGLTADDDLICETGPDGLRLTADRLRKVYVEVTSVCNLACATCIRRVWREPLGHMPVAQFQRLIQGLPGATAQVASVRHDGAAAASQPITLLNRIAMAARFPRAASACGRRGSCCARDFFCGLIVK